MMNAEIYWKVAGVLSPFISAFLTSWIASRHNLRKSRADALLQLRASAVRSISLVLFELVRYCEGKVADCLGNEIGLSLSDQFNNARMAQDKLWATLQTEKLYLTGSEIAVIEAIMPDMNMLCSAELHCESVDKDDSIRKLYEEISKRCEVASGLLFAEGRGAYGLK